MSRKDESAALAGQLLDAGVEAAEVSQKLVEVSLEASRKLLHSNVALGSAVAEFVTGQFGNLASIAAPTEFLHRQREAGESLSGKLGGYVDSLRAIGLEVQTGYGVVAKDAMAGWSARFG